MAIARGNYTASFTTATNTTQTVSFDSGSTGSDRYLIVQVNIQANSTPSGVTYAGVSMSLLASFFGQSYKIHIYGLANPTTGTNDIVVSKLASQESDVGAAVYTDVNPTGQPDSSATNTASASTTFSLTTTTVADGCWLFGGSRNNTGVATAGAGTLALAGVGGQNMWDSNGATSPAGSDSLNCERPGSSNWAGVVVSIKPKQASGPANMKTWDGLATASVKTMDGLAIASVKTWNGLT